MKLISRASSARRKKVEVVFVVEVPGEIVRELKNKVGRQWTPKEIRLGFTAKNYPVLLVRLQGMNNLRDLYGFAALNPQTKELIGVRTIAEKEEGEHKLIPVNVRKKGKGIGALLTSHALEEAWKRNAAVVSTTSVENLKWKKFLVRELGGENKKNFVEWRFPELVRRYEGMMPWREFLLKEKLEPKPRRITGIPRMLKRMLKRMLC